MQKDRLMQVLLAPHVSEKSTDLADRFNQHVFKVSPDASKSEIRKAVENLFDVKVKAVHILNVRGKQKRFGRIYGKRPNWKKASVTLEQGHDINFAGAE